MNLDEILQLAKQQTPTGSAYALAKQLQLTETTLSHWKTGRRAPDADACVKLAKVTGIDLETIIDAARDARAKKRTATRQAVSIALSLVAVVLTTNPLESRAALSYAIDNTVYYVKL